MRTIRASNWTLDSWVTHDEVFVQIRDAATDRVAKRRTLVARQPDLLVELGRTSDIHQLLAAVGLGLDGLMLVQGPPAGEGMSPVLDALVPWSAPDPWLAWTADHSVNVTMITLMLGTRLADIQTMAWDHVGFQAARAGVTARDRIQAEVDDLRQDY